MFLPVISYSLQMLRSRYLVELAVVVTISLSLAISSAEDLRVQQAIGRGVGYLVETQSSAGTWNSWGSHTIGETALAGMALVAGGHPVDSNEVRAAAQAVRTGIESDLTTYDTSLAIMFLDSLGLSGDEGLLNRLGQRLSDGQCSHGAWSYHLQGGCLGGDNSNTQFAAISSWVSRRHGIAGERALRRVDQYFRESFDDSRGGWGYVPRAGATPTMTCAGLVGIAVHSGAERQRVAEQSSSDPAAGRHTREPRQGVAMAANDPMAKRALSALGHELSLANRDPSAPINADLYFFWSLERVGVIYDVKEIGGVNWYEWGSSRLLRGQSPSGEWRGVSSKGWPLEKSVGTSFGILFLSRANVAADLSAAVGSGGGVGEPPPGLGGGSETIRRSSPNEAPPVQATPKAQARRNFPKKPEPKVGPPVLDPF